MNPEEQFFEEVFKNYRHIIYHFILRMTRNKEESEDLTQEVFIKAYKGLVNYKGEAPFKTWLYSIAKNSTYDHFRKKQTLMCLNENDRLEKEELLPENIIEMEEQKQILYRAIMELKPSYRDIVILRKVKGYQTSESASILGWTEAKVKVTLHRALLTLKIKCNQMVEI